MRIVQAFLLAIAVYFVPPVQPSHAAAPCSPRPPITLSVDVPDEHPSWLRAFVRVTTNDGLPYNEIRSIRFEQPRNGHVYAMGRDERQPFTITPPSSTQSLPIDLLRDSPVARTQVAFTVVDLCGPWPTFVATPVPHQSALQERGRQCIDAEPADA